MIYQFMPAYSYRYSHYFMQACESSIKTENCPPNAPLHKEKRGACVAVIQQQQVYPNKFINQHKDTGSAPLQPNVIVHWRIDLLSPTQEVQLHLNLGCGLNRCFLR
jgi:hypothetical protein